MHLLFMTATVLTGLLALTMALYYASKKTFPGFGHWTIGCGLIASGALMIVLRGVLPSSPAIVIQNLLFPLAAVFYLSGTRSFLGLSDMSRWWYSLPLANALFAVVTVSWFDSAAWRTVTLSLTFSAPHLLTGVLIFKDYPRTKSPFCLVLGTEMALACVLLFSFAIFSLTVSDYNVLMATSANALFLGSLMFLQIIYPFSFLILNAERFSRELLMAQDALKFSEEKYSRAFHGTPDAITITRITDGKVVEVNEAFSSITGYSRSEAQQSSTVTLNAWENPQDRDRVVALLRDQKSVRDYEAKFRTKSGQILDCLYSGEIILLGSDAHVLSVVRDITERKRAEEALRESEARFRFLTEAMVDIVWTMDLNLRFTHVSPSVERVLGFTPEERLRQSIEEQITSESLARIRDTLAGELEQEMTGDADPDRHIIIEVQNYKKGGGTAWLENIVKAIRDSQGMMIGLHGLSRDITQRREIEESLRQSEERFRLVMAATNDGVWDWNMCTNEVYRSPEFFKMLGYKPEEFPLGFEGWTELIHPDDISKTLSALDDYLSGRTDRYEVEFRMLHGEGRPVWILSRGDVVARDKDGKPTRMVGTHADITERKNLEQMLRSREELLRSTGRMAKVGGWELDAHTLELRWTDETYRIHEIPMDYKPPLEEAINFFHEDDRERLSNAIRRALDHGESYDLELRFNTATGKQLWTRTICRPEVVGGKTFKLKGTFQDITEVKRAEKAFRESEQRFRLLFERHHAVMLLIDPESGAIVGANISATKYYGYSLDALCKMKIQDINCLASEAVYAECQRAKQELRNYFVFPHRLSNGEIRTVEVHSSPIEVQGQILLFSIVHDISDRIRVEQENQALQAQLLQSQKMQALGTLAAGIAHDFNNILQGIMGYADLLLLDKKKGEPGYSELQKIIKISEDARDLVQKIRVYSRRADIQTIPLDLNNSISEVENLLRQTIPRTINIETHLTENLATINVDPRLMNQMLMNLSNNAAEAMPEGGMLIIETQNTMLDKDFCQRHPLLEPGVYVLLTISDTGRGIAPEHLGRLFDPFYSTKMRDYHKGTGLGLPFVQGIVELHKGFIDLSSEVGKGTTLKIYLPAMETAPAEKAQEELPVPPGGTETILIVEDDEIVQDLCRRTLEQFGYKVIAVTDGQEAVEVYEKEKDSIALVILDIIMPRMEGRQCVQELLKLNPGAKVLVSSGVAEEDVIENVVSLGAKDFILKPFELGNLLRKVREILDAC